MKNKYNTVYEIIAPYLDATLHILTVIIDLVQTRDIVYTSKGTWFTLFGTTFLLDKVKDELENKKYYGAETTIY